VVYASSYPITATSYDVVVGAGAPVGTYGTGTNQPGSNGEDSFFGNSSVISFANISAVGGGGGGAWSDGLSGGSGGGASSGETGITYGANGVQNLVITSPSYQKYGNKGGDALRNGFYFAGGGGGGGAGGAGGNGESWEVPERGGIGGIGGDGIQNSITGSSIYYGAGGSGASIRVTSTPGGSGVGGTGVNCSYCLGEPGSSANGTAGNGGGGSQRYAPSAGSAGVVIVRYTN
jgi:hypothetical protein